jgi:hypothetical protein
MPAAGVVMFRQPLLGQPAQQVRPSLPGMPAHKPPPLSVYTAAVAAAAVQ